MPYEKKSNSNQTHLALLILIFTGLIISRLLPLLKAPISAFGYDYGFYIDALKNTGAVNWQALLTAVWGGFNNPIFYFFNFLNFPPELALSISYLFFSFFTGLALYWFFYPHNKTAGLFALLLYSLSLVQTESYLMFLYKNAFALPFLILGLKFFNEKKWQLFFLSSLIILLSHRTTAIIYFLTLGLYWTWLLLKQKKYTLLVISYSLLVISSLSCFFFLNLKSIILNLVEHNNYNVRTGLFFGDENILKHIWPLLPLTITGLVISIKRKTNTLVLFLTGLCLVWIIFHLPFYRRIWLYFDLSLIMLSSYFLSELNYSKKYLKLALGIIIIFFAFRFSQFTWAKDPLISKQEIKELKNLDAKNIFILAVSANDAPWLLAFTNGYRLGAPGLLEDPHTYEEWQNFWQGQNQRQFISNYPRPLYLYHRDWQLPKFNLGNCLKPISRNFSEIDFVCVEKNL